MNDTLRIEVLDSLSSFAKEVESQIGISGAFLIGSLIYKSGEHFDKSRSDIDLVLLFPSDVEGRATDRFEWLVNLRSKIADLHKKLADLLGRPTNEAIVSVLAVGTLEVKLDVHKSGAVNFFASNQCYDLINQKILSMVPHAAEQALDDRLFGECIKYSQGIRNKFLDNVTPGIKEHDEDDPVPKPAMRHAAMVSTCGVVHLQPEVNTI